MRKNRQKSLFFSGVVLLLLALAPGVYAEQDAPPAPSPEEGTPAVNSCEQWMAARLGEKGPAEADLAAALLAEDAAPPSPECRLRAIYLAADQSPQSAEALYRQGRAEALAMLRKNKIFTTLDPSYIQNHLDETTDADVPALFWTGYFWGHLLKYLGTFSAASERNDVVAILGHVAEVAPEYYGGAADTWLGAYYASLPRFFGRDYEKAGNHFTRALAHTGGNEARRWTYAKSFLAGRANEHYLRILKEIAESTPPKPGSAWFIENTIARQDARTALGMK